MYPNFLCAPGAAAWVPTDLANLELWLDASDASTVLTDVDGVYQWNDKSGNGRNALQATGSKKPAVALAYQNGLDAISFDGIDDAMATAAWTAMSQPNTIYLVSERSTPGDSELDGIASGNRHLFYNTGAASNLSIHAGSGAVGASGLSTGQMYLMVGLFNSTASSLRVDGALFAGPGSIGTQSLTGLTIGNNYAQASNGLSGKLCAVLLYSELHDADTVALVETYLNEKWAIY